MSFDDLEFLICQSSGGVDACRRLAEILTKILRESPPDDFEVRWDGTAAIVMHGGADEYIIDPEHEDGIAKPEHFCSV